MNNIKTLSINSLNWKDYKKNLEEMCKLSEKDNSVASKNVNWKDWQNNIREGAMYFKQKHGYLPAWDGCVPDTSESNILSLLKQIKQKYGS